MGLCLLPVKLPAVTCDTAPPWAVPSKDGMNPASAGAGTAALGGEILLKHEGTYFFIVNMHKLSLLILGALQYISHGCIFILKMKGIKHASMAHWWESKL